MNSLLNPALEDSDKFPPIIPIGIAIEDAVESPDSSFEDIARIVGSDADLSARLLALANSSFYNYPVPVSSTSDALSVIGLRNTRNICIALTLPKRLPTHPAFPVPREKFWRHCIAVGLCARLLALECREANTERHFLAGFLHKIGRLLIPSLFPDQATDIYKRSQRRETYYQTVVHSYLGFDEAEISAATLHHWRFPQNIVALIQHYHKPVLARSHVRGVSFLHLANFIVSALNIGQSGDRFVPEFSEAAWGYAKFDESKLTLVAEELQRQLPGVCSVFLDPT